MKVGGLAENVTVVGDTPVVDVKSSATETTISQSLLFSAPITRTAINVHQLRARHQQQLGVRRRRRLGQLAPDRRRRHARSGGRHRLDLLQLQHGRGVPVPGPRRAGGVRRLHRRGRQHDHQVGRQPVLRPVRLLRHAARASAATTSPRRSPRRIRPWPIRRPRRSTPTSRRSSAGRSSRTSCSSSSAPSASCSRPIRAARVTTRHEVSPRLNGKLTWQPNAEQQRSPGTCSSTPTTSPAAPASRPDRTPTT